MNIEINPNKAILAVEEHFGLPVLFQTAGYPEEDIKVDGKNFSDCERMSVWTGGQFSSRKGDDGNSIQTATYDDCMIYRHSAGWHNGREMRVLIARVDFPAMINPSNDDLLQRLRATALPYLGAAAQRFPADEHKAWWARFDLLKSVPAALSRKDYERYCNQFSIAPRTDIDLEKMTYLSYGEYWWPDYSADQAIEAALMRRRVAGKDLPEPEIEDSPEPKQNIRDHAYKAIVGGLAAERTQQNGYSGVLFTGPDEPIDSSFIPFEHLGYNSRFGYFDMRDFPDEPTDCTNENPETIHMAIWHDEWNPIVWFDSGGNVHMLGEPHEVADLYQALGRYLLHGELSEPVDEEEVEGRGYEWIVAADAAYVANEMNPSRFPDPKSTQLQNTITAAGRRGAIRTKQGASGRPYFKRESIEDWALREAPKAGRPSRAVAAVLSRGQLWQPCSVAGCDKEPVCLNCMMCQEEHCHCFDDNGG